MHTKVRDQAQWAARQVLWTLACAAVLSVPLTQAGAAEPKTDVVRLVVDYGDGVQVHFSALPWKSGMTVLDALGAAQNHKHGITFVQRGKGAMAMITQIADVKNQGRGKNWLFAVNGQQADVGAGARELKPGDTVLWEFEAYDYN